MQLIFVRFNKNTCPTPVIPSPIDSIKQVARENI